MRNEVTGCIVMARHMLEIDDELAQCGLYFPWTDALVAERSAYIIAIFNSGCTMIRNLT